MRAAQGVLLVGGVVLSVTGAIDLVVAQLEEINALLLVSGTACLVLYRTASRRLAARAALVFVSIGAAIGISEGAIRVLSLDRFSIEPYIPEVNETFHHNYRPNDSFVRRPTPPDNFVPVTNQINSLGIRGPEVETSTAWAVLIGDSFIQADEVEYEKTVGQVLERKLRKVRADAVIVSHGMGSWSPLLEWNWYLKMGRRFSPRFVFLFVFYNDFDPLYSGLSDHYYLTQAVFGSDGRPDYFNVGPRPSPVHRGLRSLRLAALWRLARERVRPGAFASALGQFSGSSTEHRVLNTEEIDQLLEAPQDVFDDRVRTLGTLPSVAEGFWQLQRPLHLWPSSLRKTVDQSKLVLARFAEDVARDGARLVMVYVPIGFQIGHNECDATRSTYGLAPDAIVRPRSGLQQWLEGVARDHDIAWLDPTEALRASAAGVQQPLYLSYDCHWSDTGHARMADILVDRLLRAGV